MTVVLNVTDAARLNTTPSVLAGGCFDVIHPSHIEFLTKAKKLGGQLIIFLESDENIRKLKGEKRPLNKQGVRAENLSKLGIIDYIILLDKPSSQDYYYNLVKLVHPAIIAVTDDDPLLEVKKNQAAMVGGKVEVVMKRNLQHSTSSIINRKQS